MPLPVRPGRRRRRRFVLPRVPWRRWVRRARRSPWVWWTAAGLLAVVAATRVSAIDDEAEARRAAWGEAATVIVAVHDLAPGEVIGETDVTVDRWPRAVVPAGALSEAPVGRTVAAPIVTGEAVLAARVAPDGLSDVAALVPVGWRAVAVPAASSGFGADAPPLRVGDRVDVLATTDGFDVTTDAATETVARGALVVDVAETSVTVAVRSREAEQVAGAATRGTVTLALAGAE